MPKAASLQKLFRKVYSASYCTHCTDKVVRSSYISFVPILCLLQQDRTPLYIAAEENLVEAVEYLIDLGVDVNTKDKVMWL